MCGRYTLRTSPELLERHFEISETPRQIRLSFNIAPTQPVAAVRASASGGRELVELRWGLVPFWADDPSIGSRMINARSETVTDKPAFRAAFKSRRCLVVADGFYEWKASEKKGGVKQPFYIRLASDEPFAFAGLWERWDKAGEPLETCTIITTTANELMEPIHDRMPVILPPSLYDLWLAPAPHDHKKLAALLRPFPSTSMTLHPVSTLVNKPANDSPRCVEPLPA